MDWAARIKRAERKGKFTAVDQRLADEWLTCAVGEKYVKRTENAEPKRGTSLYRWGAEFATAVTDNEIEIAKTVYQQIQDYKE